jgi:hypothetical protein
MLRRLSSPSKRAHASIHRIWGLALLAALVFGLSLSVSGCGNAAAATSANSDQSGGTGSSASVVISTNSVAFGSVAVGQTANASVQVTNNGSSSVQLSTPQITGQFFSLVGQSGGAVSVGAGSSHSFSLQFAPTAAGTQTGSMSVTAGSDTLTVALSGTGEAAQATPGLTLQSTSVSFGDVTVNTAATQTVLLTSSGTAALTVGASSVTGAGFSLAGSSFPVTLQPGQTANLTIQFDPTATGAATGAVTLTTNTSAGSAVVAVSGTGVTGAAYAIDLSWNPPTNSTDPMSGYDVYRAVSGSSSYQLLNSSVEGTAAYTDTSVQSGTSYTYYVVSVDASGNQSSPSNLFSVNVP